MKQISLFITFMLSILTIFCGLVSFSHPDYKNVREQSSIFKIDNKSDNFTISDNPQFIDTPIESQKTVEENCYERRGSLVHLTRTYKCRKVYSIKTGKMAYRLLNIKTGKSVFVGTHEGIIKTVIRTE